MTSIVALSFFLLNQTLPIWKIASDYSARTAHNFLPYAKEKKIYVLNMPDNYQWVTTFRNGFSEYLYFNQHENVMDKITIVSWFSMKTISDSVEVKKPSNKEIFVSCKGSEKRFLLSGLWATSYQTENYRVDFDSTLTSYHLTFTDVPSDAVFLYVSGDKWRRL